MPDLNPPVESPTRPHPASQSFRSELQSSGRAAIWIRTYGELDLATAPQFQQTLYQAISGAQLIVIDLRQLTFMDCVGIRLLIDAHGRARRSGRQLVLIRGSKQLDRLFALVGIVDHVQIIDLRAILASA